MPSRPFEVDAENILPDGFWPGEAIEVPADASRSELEQLLADAAVVLERIGGTFSIVAIRQELTDQHGNPTGLFVPVKYRAKWESFAPALRAQQPAPPAQEAPAEPPAPEPEPSDLTAEEIADHFPEETEPLADDDFGPDAERALTAAEQG